MMTYEMQYLKNKRKMVALSIVGLILLVGMFFLNHYINYTEATTSNQLDENVIAKK